LVASLITTVSGAAIFKGNEEIGLVDNKVFGVLDTKPRHVGFTLNSDTPYGPVQLDLSAGPFVVELPPGPLIVVAMDVNQRWVADMGIPGPDEGKGGKHVILPPGYSGKVPAGHHVWKSPTNHVMVGVRSLPVDGDVAGASSASRRSDPPARSTGRLDGAHVAEPHLEAAEHDAARVGGQHQVLEVLHQVIEAELPSTATATTTASLRPGIAKGKPFTPDARMTRILEQAARAGLAQMRRRPSPIGGPIASCGTTASGNGSACGRRMATSTRRRTSTSMRARCGSIRRSAPRPRCFAGRRFGIVYWLGLRDATGVYLDGEDVSAHVAATRGPAVLS
jgi:hypothetical protein